MNAWQSRMLGILRMVVAVMFMQHGAQKLFGYPSAGSSPVELLSIFGLAGVLELLGGALVAVGLFTRPVAFLLAGQMAVAYFWRHAPGGFWPLVNHGELAVLYCFAFLYLVAAGAGAWSLDGAARKAAARARVPAA